MLTTVPFSGFYNSLHDSEIDLAIEQMFSDDNGNAVNPGLDHRLWLECDFQKVYLAYAEAYVESFADEFKLKTLKWESMKSPREYNFTTDRLFATISYSEVCRLVRETGFGELQRVATANLTSYDGFASFYDPNVLTWGPIKQWDHNLVGLLLVAHVGKDFDHYAEHSLMEDARGNGWIDEWIHEATPNIGRLFKAHDYLQARAKRKRAEHA